MVFCVCCLGLVFGCVLVVQFNAGCLGVSSWFPCRLIGNAYFVDV